MAELRTIVPTPLTPSERLLREILTESVTYEGCGVSDVIVVWTDEMGRQNLRSAVNDATNRGDERMPSKPERPAPPQPPPMRQEHMGGPLMRLLLACVLGPLIMLLAIYLMTPTDTTDRGFLRRSGLELLRDELTGCEYLSRSGALTPRLDRDGKHICHPIRDAAP